MGRKTWESLPDSSKPLSNRLNVVLTRNQEYAFNCPEGQTPPLIFPSLLDSLESLSASKKVAEIFLIGGQRVFEDALTEEMRQLCKLIISTRINKDYDADVFMPKFEDFFEPIFISKTYS